MDRRVFHRLFKAGGGPAVLPVVHVLDKEQAIRNVRIAIQEGAQGVFLINHDFHHNQLVPIIRSVRETFLYVWLGVNFLGVSGSQAFPILGDLASQGVAVDAYWADNAHVDERVSLDQQETATAISRVRRESDWKGLYFGGTAFKMQRTVADDKVGVAASLATHFMDVVTTSGSATGVAANMDKIRAMRASCGDAAMAIASGITPANASDYIPYVDCFLVATGVSGDFYNFDPIKLRSLIHICRTQSPTQPSSLPSDPWYLNLIAPNTKGDKFAWLDPTSVYIDGCAFSRLVDDLIAQFDVHQIDLVAGIDAMGFPLGSAIATKLGKGFLALRQAGKLCVEVDQIPYTCYSKKEKMMEVRKNAFASGTRVLIVDQWIETGGTMAAAIQLVERQGGVVAGAAVICVETNPKTTELRQKYKVAHVVPSLLQQLFDDHSFIGQQTK